MSAQVSTPAGRSARMRRLLATVDRADREVIALHVLGYGDAPAGSPRAAAYAQAKQDAFDACRAVRRAGGNPEPVPFGLGHDIRALLTPDRLDAATPAPATCGWELTLPPGGQPTGLTCQLPPHGDGVIHAVYPTPRAADDDEGKYAAALRVLAGDAPVPPLTGTYRYTPARDQVLAVVRRPDDAPLAGEYVDTPQGLVRLDHPAAHWTGRDQLPHTD